MKDGVNTGIVQTGGTMNVDVQAVGPGATASKTSSAPPAGPGPAPVPAASPAGTTPAGRFQVAVSFADEDRPYVGSVVSALHARGVRVFYDVEQEIELWGKDLTAYLDDVYRNRSDYVVVFISRAYVEKEWARHELRSALARAIRERREYVLPARFDETDVPGLPPTVRHVDLRQTTPDDLAEMIGRKIASA